MGEDRPGPASRALHSTTPLAIVRPALQIRRRCPRAISVRAKVRPDERRARARLEQSLPRPPRRDPVGVNVSRLLAGVDPVHHPRSPCPRAGVSVNADRGETNGPSLATAVAGDFRSTTTSPAAARGSPSTLPVRLALLEPANCSSVGRARPPRSPASAFHTLDRAEVGGPGAGPASARSPPLDWFRHLEPNRSSGSSSAGPAPPRHRHLHRRRCRRELLAAAASERGEPPHGIHRGSSAVCVVPPVP